MGRRSLSLRVTLALLAALAIVFTVLLMLIVARALASDSGEVDSSLRANAEAVLSGIDTAGSEDAVRAIFRVFEHPLARDDSNASALTSHLVAIERATGRSLATRGAPDLGRRVLVPGPLREVIDGRRYRGYVVQGGRWQVLFLDEQDARRQDVVLHTIAELGTFMAIALPLLLVPVWLAVRAGMKPLRRLSDAIARRDPADVAPLPETASYTELDPLVHALDRQFRSAAERIQREQTFVHDAAHELRTPMAAIAAQAHVLALSEGEARIEALRRLEGAVARCSHLVHQLLSLARADAGRAQPIVQGRADAFELMALLRDTLVLVEPVARAARCELSLHGPDVAMVNADRELLRTAVVNLVDNAVKYGGEGGSVEVSLVQQSSHWVLTVADRGPGLPEGDLDRAFFRFWRAPGQGASGTGLGLAIVREVMHGLGGEARLQLRTGGGCEAQLSWPIGEALQLQDRSR